MQTRKKVKTLINLCTDACKEKKKYSNQNKKGLVDVLRCYHRRLKYGSKLFHEAKILTHHLKVVTRTHTHACSSTRFFSFFGGVSRASDSSYISQRCIRGQAGLNVIKTRGNIS